MNKGYFKLSNGGIAEITKYSCCDYYIKRWNSDGIQIDSKKKRTTKRELYKSNEIKEKGRLQKWIITQGKC